MIGGVPAEATPLAPADPPVVDGVAAAPAAATGSSDLRRSAWWWIRAAAIALAVYASYQVLVVLGGVLQSFFKIVLYLAFGGIVSFLAGPLVDALHRYLRVPRTVAILTTLLGGLAVLSGAVYLAAGPTVNEARSLAEQVPDLIQRANNELQSLRDQLHNKGIDTSSFDLSGSGNGLANRISSVLLTTIGGTVSFVIDVVITFVVAFWLLKDGDRLRLGLLTLLPGRARVQMEFALDATGVVIGGYVRAQLFLALVIGAMAGIGCAVIGVPFPIVVALAAGIFELIPIVGPFVGGAVAIALALTVSVNLALVTLLLFIGIHVVEGYVLGPRIQAKFVRLHPLVSLLALFAGIDIGGFLGALFAVPIASLVAVFIRAAVGDVRASRPELYEASAPDAFSEHRRETILREFRLFKRSPVAMMRGRLRRTGPVPSTPAAPPPIDTEPSLPHQGPGTSASSP